MAFALKGRIVYVSEINDGTPEHKKLAEQTVWMNEHPNSKQPDFVVSYAQRTPTEPDEVSDNKPAATIHQTTISFQLTTPTIEEPVTTHLTALFIDGRPYDFQMAVHQDVKGPDGKTNRQQILSREMSSACLEQTTKLLESFPSEQLQ